MIQHIERINFSSDSILYVLSEPVYLCTLYVCGVHNNYVGNGMVACTCILGIGYGRLTD